MPNKPPSDRTHANLSCPVLSLPKGRSFTPSPEGVPPVFNLGLSAGDPPSSLLPRASCLNFTKRTQFAPRPPSADPKIRNKPNSRIPSVPPPPISAKQTQSHKADSQNTRNEPNPSTPGTLPPRPCPHLCETNPIYHRFQISPHFTKQTQSSYPRQPPLRKTNQISHTPGVPPAFHPPLRETNPIYHRFQISDFPPFYETNPISVPPSYRWRLAGIPILNCAKRTQSPYPRRPAGFPPLIVQNEPNSACPTSLAAPHCAKRTQFPYPPRTAGVSPAFRSSIVRNEPNPSTQLDNIALKGLPSEWKEAGNILTDSPPVITR